MWTEQELNEEKELVELLATRTFNNVTTVSDMDDDDFEQFVENMIIRSKYK